MCDAKENHKKKWLCKILMERRAPGFGRAKFFLVVFFHIMVAELKVLLEVFLGVTAVDIFWPYFGLDS